MPTSHSNVIELARQLIAQPSLTPNDAGCQEIISQRLERLGFTIEGMRFADVDNLWARRGKTEPLFVFAGHTDVVPTGPSEQWQSPPFSPTIRNGLLYGRGAADMKGSLASMIIGCEQFINQHPNHNGSIAFLITSDEEGQAINGTRKVVEHLTQRGEKLTWCIVGEASSDKQLGDTLKIGRRGSLNGHLIIQGKQGHIAYPELADNPVHRFSAALHTLVQTVWDQGYAAFPPTSFQFSNIHAGTGADNVIPNQLEVTFNFRYSPAVTAEQLQQKVISILDQQQLNYTIAWRHSGAPFLTSEGELVAAAKQSIVEINKITPILSTSGGTSDGRFIAPMGCQVIELGPINSSIHQINEHVSIADLEQLANIHQRILQLLLL